MRQIERSGTHRVRESRVSEGLAGCAELAALLDSLSSDLVDNDDLIQNHHFGNRIISFRSGGSDSLAEHLLFKGQLSLQILCLLRGLRRTIRCAAREGSGSGGTEDCGVPCK